MNINASIKKQYLDMILKGTKKTEYRDMSPYWTQKLLDMSKYSGKSVEDVVLGLQKGTLEPHPRDIDTITFYCNRQVERYQVLEIKTYTGHKMFAIRLGKHR